CQQESNWSQLTF
nr:immunoglobulin light chain junction region [Macaca mulatta]